jgi:hypothetical protein
MTSTAPPDLEQPTFRHTPGLPPTTPIVATDALLGVQGQLLEAIDKHLILMVTGPNGSGKTSGVSFALEEAAHVRDFACVEVRVTNNPNPKALLTHFCHGMGIALPGSSRATTQELLLDRVLEELTSRPWVVWLDECENASAAALRIIRHIFDEPGIRGALVMSGDNRLVKHLNQREHALLSRVGRTQRFERISDDDVVALMSKYQEVFARTDPARLVHINKLVRGSFRNWARLAEVVDSRRNALHVAPDHITDELFDLLKEPMGWL